MALSASDKKLRQQRALDIVQQVTGGKQNKGRQSPTKPVDPAKEQRVKDAILKATKKDSIEQIVSRAPSGSLHKKKAASMKWFYDKLKSAYDPSNHNQYNPVKDPFIGGMFMWVYDAKHKDTLPYWDAFPLVIIVEKYADGFLGLNVHYLPPILRAKLLDILFGHKTKKSTRQYMNISYKILVSAMKTPYYAPCVKRYLTSHIKSKIIKVDHEEWENTAFLPVANWQGATEKQVHADSRKRVG
jgi:hypothetical protein